MSESICSNPCPNWARPLIKNAMKYYKMIWTTYLFQKNCFISKMGLNRNQISI